MTTSGASAEFVVVDLGREVVDVLGSVFWEDWEAGCSSLSDCGGDFAGDADSSGFSTAGSLFWGSCFSRSTWAFASASARI